VKKVIPAGMTFFITETGALMGEVKQHIPNKGEDQIRHYGWYSNKQWGIRNKEAEKGELPQEAIGVFCLLMGKMVKFENLTLLNRNRLYL
jgi:hypothetical protein